MGAVVSLEEARRIRTDLTAAGRIVVATNGCFDLLHRGHVEYLAQARALGDVLMVGVNSDRSVRTLKGPGRPVVTEIDRASVLAALASVDYAVVFDATHPRPFLEAVQPEVLVKGGDWAVEEILGREQVERAGGRVVSIPSAFPGESSSALVERAIGGRGTGAPEGEDRDPARTSLRDASDALRKAALLLPDAIEKTARMIVRALRGGGRVLLCGDEDGALVAQHLARELCVRLCRERSTVVAVPVIAGGDSPAGDRGNASRDDLALQVRSVGRIGDVLLALSSSDISFQVLRAVEAAREMGLSTAGLTGRSAGRLAPLLQVVIAAPGSSRQQVQEVHLVVGHVLCALVEALHVTRRSVAQSTVGESVR
ncbi:MAG: adenylyltransferase/cytidyltransferase family protein [Gemmatimonadetes bacterium]|nr:adenylyltransferase/cytidyltransferase family protein [Gemmatimonadota bacterium]